MKSDGAGANETQFAEKFWRPPRCEGNRVGGPLIRDGLGVARASRCNSTFAADGPSEPADSLVTGKPHIAASGQI